MIAIFRGPKDQRYEGGMILNGIRFPEGTVEEIAAFYNASGAPGSLEAKDGTLVYHPPQYGVMTLPAVTSTRPPNRKERRAATRAVGVGRKA